MINQKILIIILAVSLSAIVTWFVVIDNVIIPAVVSGNQLSWNNGYETGTNDAIINIIQQSVTCTPVSLWSGNNTVQLINVQCLQDVSDWMTP